MSETLKTGLSKFSQEFILKLLPSELIGAACTDELSIITQPGAMIAPCLGSRREAHMHAQSNEGLDLGMERGNTRHRKEPLLCSTHR